MAFNSFRFLVFFAVLLPIYWTLPLRWQRYLLLVASYYFYMVWRAKYALLIGGITLLDFGVGLGMGRLEDRPKTRRTLLIVSIAANLGLLFVFKYWKFFGQLAQWTLGWAHWTVAWPTLDVVLPLGISFHTFQSLSYTIDVYRRKAPVERSLTNFALYVAFFPQLVAGPIERPGHLLPQFRERRPFVSEEFIDGLRLVALGLFKKMAVADNLALFVDQVYGPQGTLYPPSLLLGTYAYAFQIYADFSGYSDIAIGVARMMGFRLVTNFDTPYFSASVTEFWRRWHISLSSWLRDYLYIPLGGNRLGRERTYVNLLITMLLGGLWHGANWTFVVWGALNGLYLCASKAWADATAGRWQRIRYRWPIVLRGLGVLLTFHLICFSWIFFRAPDLGRARAIATTLLGSIATGALFGHAGRLGLLAVLARWRTPMTLAALLVAVDAWAASGERREHWYRIPLPLRYVGYSTIVLATLVFGVFRETHFIYFQF